LGRADPLADVVATALGDAEAGGGSSGAVEGAGAVLAGVVVVVGAAG
jgi:hypothetical protein